jgi:hypothetical protein
MITRTNWRATFFWIIIEWFKTLDQGEAYACHE